MRKTRYSRHCGSCTFEPATHARARSRGSVGRAHPALRAKPRFSDPASTPCEVTMTKSALRRHLKRESDPNLRDLIEKALAG